MSKNFYQFDQNNSYGIFDVDDKVCPIIIIEADTESEAIEKGLDLGIYFDGCNKGIDCPCCGDRWVTPNILEFPLKYRDEVFKDVVTYAQYCVDTLWWLSTPARIYYKDSTVTEFFKK